MNVRLVTYRPTLTASGVYINNGAGYAVSTTATTIVVDGASAETFELDVSRYQANAIV